MYHKWKTMFGSLINPRCGLIYPDLQVEFMKVLAMLDGVV